MRQIDESRGIGFAERQREAKGDDAEVEHARAQTCDHPLPAPRGEITLPVPGEIADNLGEIVGAPPGSIFLGPNVSVLQSALGSALQFTPARNEVVYEALQFPSLTYVWT